MADNPVVSDEVVEEAVVVVEDTVVVDEAVEGVRGLLCNVVKMKVGRVVVVLSAAEIMIEAASKRALLGAYCSVALFMMAGSIWARSLVDAS